MDFDEKKVWENIEDRINKIEKGLKNLKKISEDLEIKDQYVIQSMDSSIYFLKKLNEIFKQYQDLEDLSNNMDNVIKSIFKIIKEINPYNEEELNNQMRKIKAIYSIFKNSLN